jgi:hypothetical protein
MAEVASEGDTITARGSSSLIHAVKATCGLSVEKLDIALGELNVCSTLSLRK